MDFDDLRRSPVYHQSLQTSGLIGQRPPRFAHEHRESYELRDAGLRLDHLIRRALQPAYDFPEMRHLSAIKAFIEVMEPRIPSMTFSDRVEAMAFITPRLELAKEIIVVADRILVEHGYSPVSSQEFRDLVAADGNTSQTRFTIDEIVWDNPLYMIEKGWGLSRSYEQDRVLYHFLHNYWD